MYRIAVDRGGTFTDVFAVCPDQRIVTMKLLSVQPSQYPDAPFEAIRRIFSADNKDILKDHAELFSIRMGTTVATNALLEHKGERVALVLTKGFRDVFQIGNQSRENIFELNMSDPFRLYEDIVEVDERVVIHNEKCEITKHLVYEPGLSGDKVAVLKPLDRQALERDLKKVFDAGIRSLAVSLIHSYNYPQHELMVESVAKEMGFTHISLSSKIVKMIRYVPRGSSYYS